MTKEASEALSFVDRLSGGRSHPLPAQTARPSARVVSAAKSESTDPGSSFEDQETRVSEPPRDCV